MKTLKFTGKLLGLALMASFNTSAQDILVAKEVFQYDSAYHRTEASTYVFSNKRTSEYVMTPLATVATTKSDTAIIATIVSGTTTVSNRTLQAFDGDNNDTLNIIQTKSGSATVWTNLTKTFKTYNADKQLIDLRTYSWNAGKWDSVAHVMHHYVGGLLMLDSSVAYISSAWVNENMTTYSYVGTNLNSKTNLMWSGGSWENVTRQYFDYIGTVKNETLLQTWSSGWKNTYVEDYVYAGGKLTETLYHPWNDDSNSFIRARKVTNSFYAGNLVSTLIEKWDTGKKAYVNVSGKFYNYSIDNKMVEYTEKNWNGASWKDMNQKIFSYTGMGSLSKETSNIYNGSAWKPFVGTNSRINYYYVAGTAIKSEGNIVNKATLYPNPATAATVTIDYATASAEATTVVMMNINGQVIFRATESANIGNHSVVVPVSNFASGMYIVNIYTTKGLAQTLKMTK